MSSTTKKRLVWGTMVAGAVVATGWLMPGTAKGNDIYTSAPPAASAPVSTLNSAATVQALSDTFSSVVEKTSPAVVFIEIEKKAQQMPAGFFDGDGSDGPQNFFGFPMPPQFRGHGRMGPQSDVPMTVGEGSGFIISKDGYIVTNNHVAGDADRLKVKLADGREYEAKLIGTDPQTEVALIKIDATDLPIAVLGDSDAMKVGEWVLAIGSPFGLSHTVTSGIVSARGRGDVGIVDYSDFIQTDAAINPGNSGGPLLNIRGEVIGMNTAIVSRSGGSDGVGFAIPVNMVKYVVDQLKDHGTVSRGFLGIGIQELTPDLAKWFGTKESHGILVAEVVPDSPAAKAGIEKDDVILEYGGQPVGEVGAFRSQISTMSEGRGVDLTIDRKGERITKHVQIGVKSSEELAKNSEKSEAREPQQGKLGIAIEPLTEDLAKQFGIDSKAGVVVTQVAPGSPAMRAGIKPGAVITEVNRKQVNNPKEFLEALKDKGDNGSTLLRVQQGEGSRYVAIETTK